MSTSTMELEHSHVGRAVGSHSHHVSRNNKIHCVLRNVKVHRTTKKSTSTGNATAVAGRRVLIDADGVVTELNDKAFEAAMNAAMGVMGRHRMITTGQAAKLMNCSPRTVARILDSGRLPFTRNGGTGRRHGRRGRHHGIPASGTCAHAGVLGRHAAGGSGNHDGRRRNGRLRRAVRLTRKGPQRHDPAGCVTGRQRIPYHLAARYSPHIGRT